MASGLHASPIRSLLRRSLLSSEGLVPRHGSGNPMVSDIVRFSTFGSDGSKSRFFEELPSHVEARLVDPPLFSFDNSRL